MRIFGINWQRKTAEDGGGGTPSSSTKIKKIIADVFKNRSALKNVGAYTGNFVIFQEHDKSKPAGLYFTKSGYVMGGLEMCTYQDNKPIKSGTYDLNKTRRYPYIDHINGPVKVKNLPADEKDSAGSLFTVRVTNANHTNNIQNYLIQELFILRPNGFAVYIRVKYAGKFKGWRKVV